MVEPMTWVRESTPIVRNSATASWCMRICAIAVQNSAQWQGAKDVRNWRYARKHIGRKFDRIMRRTLLSENTQRLAHGSTP